MEIQKRYLVIGANSFLAREIIRELHPHHKVTGVYHVNTNNLIDGVDYVSMNQLNDLPDDYDVVFFISAYIPNKKETDPEQLIHVNVRLVEEVCLKFKSAKIIYASSVSVYSNAISSLTEMSETGNTSSYGASKLQGENIIRMHPHFSILRISSMYGPGMNLETFLPRIILNSLNKKEIVLYGDGCRLQNYVHVSDVAEFMINASHKKGSDIYLAVNTVSHSNKQLSEMVADHIGGVSIVYAGTDNSPSYLYNAENTYKELGYPKKKVELEIVNIIKWMQR